MREVTWYAVYDCQPEDGGCDADYMPCTDRESAMEEAASYLNFATGEGDEVYVVAVPNAVCITDNEEWSLWDCLGDIAADGASNFVYLHRGVNRQ
jgi:hypothetical protein